MPIRNYLPKFLSKPLWGDCESFGLTPQPNDRDWINWLNTTTSTDFYIATQRNKLGTYVNDVGYRIMSKIDLEGKIILEIGAGDIRHMRHWIKMPKKYIVADIRESMMSLAIKKLSDRGVNNQKLIVNNKNFLNVKSESVDIVVSFYSLEHLYPLENYLSELERILKPGGYLIGAIPTEGGFAWGLGRMVTSRRWFHKNTKINPDKIICWEHPNFADDIINNLDEIFHREKLNYWPFSFLRNIDINLVMSVIYRKK